LGKIWYNKKHVLFFGKEKSIPKKVSMGRGEETKKEYWKRMMKIKMAGIEHDKAELAYRELFSFSSHAAAEAMEQLRERYGTGCVLLSTCNRTELWISLEECGEEKEEAVPSPFEMLCHLKKVSAKDFKEIAAEREDEAAVYHLFRLACGMESKIFGEDQIITQVKNALLLAREHETADIVLEKLFQSAVTAAKKVKTEVRLTARDASVVERMLQILRETFEKETTYDKEKKPFLNGKNCLVIGNGEIGRLSAVRLLEEGADVTMTLRQYKDQSAAVPEGCRAIAYQDRLSCLAEYDIIVSGTSSPHHTLKYEDTQPVLADGKERILVDLAVPRDISSRLCKLPNLTVYNIDTIGSSTKDRENSAEYKQAEEILEKYLQEYSQWYYFREFIPVIHGISRTAANEIYKRLERPVRKLEISKEEKAALEKTAKTSAETVVSSMMYGLREHLDRTLWDRCILSLETSMLDSIRKKDKEK
jgi:glutamyl-tRNA reductase